MPESVRSEAKNAGTDTAVSPLRTWLRAAHGGVLTTHRYKAKLTIDNAVETRYADDWRNLGRQEALEALLIARRVRDEVRALLPAEVTA